MKVSKIPGLGSYGVFVDGVDFNYITDDEWMEIGDLYIKNLVVIIRNTNLDYQDQQKWVRKFGGNRDIVRYDMAKRYNLNYEQLWKKVRDKDPDINQDDYYLLAAIDRVLENTRSGSMMRVSGKKDEIGNPTGMFAEGDLLWHSNEAGTLAFTPGIALFAKEGVKGTSTGFVQTVDYYENVSESFRSELNDMIIHHRYLKGAINPGYIEEQDRISKASQCPIDDIEIPLVIQSPGGIRGLHYSVNTVYSIKGMSKEDSDKVFAEINKNLFVEKYVYDHWYQNEGDFLFFDNSVTLHRRLGDTKQRLCYRVQHDLTNLQKGFWQPYFQPEFQENYRTLIEDFVKVLDIKDFKL